MKRLLLLLAALAAVFALEAQKVDTVAVTSRAMDGKQIKNVVILPSGYGDDTARRYPVVYLLHGHGGRYDTWINRSRKDLPELISAFGVIAVCPDGANSWYWDSPVDPALRYDTYVSRELVEYIDSHYHTVASAAGRAVTGFSMGGHGGLWLGFTHQDVYGACGSMAGGVDIRPFPDKWHMSNSLGAYEDNPRVWDSHTVVEQVHLLSPGGKPAIIIDCGTGDFFYRVNEDLHRKLLENGIDHEYVSRPGAHTHPYWASALDGQLLFFRKYFDSAEAAQTPTLR